jgi:hypothetical protein
MNTGSTGGSFFMGKKGRIIPFSEKNSQEFMTSEYGGTNLVLMQDRSDIRYYRVNNRDNNLNVPDASAPSISEIPYVSDKSELHSNVELMEISEMARNVGEGYCDELMKRRIIENVDTGLGFNSNVDEYYEE